MTVTVLRAGVHEDHPVDTTLARFPRATLCGPYFLGQVPPDPALVSRVNRILSPAWTAGLTPAWTFKPDPTLVGKGAWDAPLTALRDKMAGPCLVYPWHEPEDDMPGATFVPYFNRIYRLLHSDQVQVGYAAGTFAWRPLAAETANPAAWRPTAVDFWAADVYSGKSFPADATLATHAGFQRWWTTLVRGGPFVITERGFQGDPAVRVKAIQAEAAWLAQPTVPCVGYLYWNTAGTENNPGWVLDTAGELAVAALLQGLRAKAAGPGYRAGYADGWGDRTAGRPGAL